MKTSSTYYHINDGNGKLEIYQSEWEWGENNETSLSGVADKNESKSQEKGGKN
jgi:hypothetical protein